MRIGLDLLATQSPHHAHRGIGRFARGLIDALVDVAGTEHELVSYVYSDLRRDLLPAVPEASIRLVAADGPSIVPVTDRLVRENPDRLDAYLVVSPVEWWGRYVPPSRTAGGPLCASVVHDLIPLLWQDEPGEPRLPASYVRSIAELRRYDVLLTNSEATRRDCLRILELPETKVVTIGGGCDRELFSAPTTLEPGSEERAELKALGIDRPFLVNVSGMDERKNVYGVVEAFARLPQQLRRRHQLVLAFQICDDDRERLTRYAAAKGVAESVVIAGHVSDADLVLLLRRCAVFVLISKYEGFGLPILEAMRCGAPVITANNSSQPEVAGDGGLIVNAADPSDAADAMKRLLSDPVLAATLRRNAARRADQQTWEGAARRTLDALIEKHAGCARSDSLAPRSSRVDRPRLAFFSPMPPQKSGVADYADNLFRELRKHYAVDVFYDGACTPDVVWSDLADRCCDATLFERMRPHRDYHGIVYQMGNSRYHRFLYPHLLAHRGVTTLHDFCLGGFHLWYGHEIGRQRDYFAERLAESVPEHAAELLGLLDTHGQDPERVITACARRGAYMNRMVFERSKAVVVHSPWCVDRLRESAPDLVDKSIVIVHGARPERTTAAERAAIRARFSMPEDALIVAAFGFIHPDKMSGEALSAFRAVATNDPRALFVFVGQDADAGYTRSATERLGLVDRVRFLGRQDAENFARLAAVTDIGFNLRRPPTNGETSGALLNLLRWGVPTIVTDVGTFSDYPDDVVRKVKWQAEGQAGLDRALRELAESPERRAALGDAAWEHVRKEHDWARVAEQYIEVIERSRRRTTAAA